MKHFVWYAVETARGDTHTMNNERRLQVLVAAALDQGRRQANAKATTSGSSKGFAKTKSVMTTEQGRTEQRSDERPHERVSFTK